MSAYFNDRIVLSDAGGRVAIHAGAQPVAASDRAIRLSERGYPPRYYLPADSLVAARLFEAALRTHCPYKGDACYYHLLLANDRLDEAAWVYPTPYEQMQAIAGYIAFDHPALTVQVDTA
jgi:uncharacterized protein (DUF427 family)